MLSIGHTALLVGSSTHNFPSSMAKKAIGTNPAFLRCLRMTNKTPGANADLPRLRENFPNHKRHDLFQQKRRMQVGTTHSGFLQSCWGVCVCVWRGGTSANCFSQRDLWSRQVKPSRHRAAAHLNAPPMLTLLWGHLLGKKDWSGGVE